MCTCVDLRSVGLVCCKLLGHVLKSQNRTKSNGGHNGGYFANLNLNTINNVTINEDIGQRLETNVCTV